MSLVSVAHVRKADDHLNLKEAIEKSFDLIGFRFSSDVQSIVVKPNMCCYSDYSTGITTDPKIIAALVDFLKESVSSDAQISIVESDASAMKFDYSTKILGYEKMSNEKSVELVNLTEDSAEEVRVQVANIFYTFLLPVTIKSADLFINVPKIRYMLGTKISCGLKNIFGCNPYPKKFKYHPHLSEVIVGLNKIMKPDLCLLDGVIVHGKYAKKLGLIMASSDPVALDSAAARIAGENPRKINHIVLAEKEGLGSLNYKVVGESLQSFAKQFPKRNARDKIRFAVNRLGMSTIRKLGLSIPPY